MSEDVIMYQLQSIGKRGVLFSTDTIPGCVTNFYLIKGDRRNYVIDTGLGTSSAAEVIKLINNSCPKQTVIINTHYHWDHIWGNSAFGEVDIVAHRSAPFLIAKNWDEMETKCSKWKEGDVVKTLPNILISDYLHFADDAVEIFHTPGHTGDSISVFDYVDNVLYVGDNIEDLMPSVYDTKENLVNSIRKYLEYNFGYCLSGHNSNLSREDLKKVLSSLNE